MTNKMNEQILERNPSLASAKDKLAMLTEGSYCIHRSWGFGQVKTYDEAQNRLIIDFSDTGHRDHPMDPVFCVEKLELLPRSSILIKQHNDPERINLLIKENPGELIREIIKEIPEEEISAPELERILSRLVGDTKFKRWWTKAKKSLIQNSSIAVPKRATEPYALMECHIPRESELLEAFYATKPPHKKIILAEELLSLCSSGKSIEGDLSKALDTLSEILTDGKKLTPAQRLQGMWVRDDLAKYLGQEVQELPFQAASLLHEKDLQAIAKGLAPNGYGRFLKLLTQVHSDYTQPVLELLRNSSGKFTNECVQLLLDNNLQAPLVSALKRWLDERMLKAPIIHWAIKNRRSRRLIAVIEPIMVPALLNAAFYAIDEEVHQSTGNARIQLADTLSEDPEIIQELLALANTETARDLAYTLLMKQGFNDLTKRSILARFIRLFPSIQSLISGSDDSKSSEGQLIVSAESMERRKKEYEHLVAVDIPNNKEAIAIAREHGDLRENAEYKMAKEDQGTLMARKAQMERELGQAIVKDFSKVPSDTVAIGSTITLKAQDSNKEYQFSILGAWDSDPEKNILSYKTPIAQALINKKIGDALELDISGQTETWVVARLECWRF